MTISEPAPGNYKTNFDAANQSNPATDATFKGAGIHSDVHNLNLVSSQLWVGCDGGVFRRDTAGNAAAMNAGLAVSEPGYLASHPDYDGPCIAGTQDNGQIVRVGDTVWKLWRKGDGGGTAFHPHEPNRFLGQYIRSEWYVNNGGITGPIRHGNFWRGQLAADGMAHRR